MKYYVYELINWDTQRPFYINVGTGMDFISKNSNEEVEKYKNKCNWRSEIKIKCNDIEDAKLHMERIKNNLTNGGIVLL